MDSGERKVSVTCVAAFALWTVTFILILAGTITSLASPQHLAIVLALLAHGLGVSAMAATVSIRAMIQQQNRMLRDAFSLGRDSVGGGSVRRMN